MKRESIRLIILPALTVFLLSGCSRQSLKVTLPPDSPEAFSFSGDQEVPAMWWTVFGDKGLDAMVDSALRSNYTLEAAWQRLISARAIVRRESSSFFPDLFASLQGEVIDQEQGFEESKNLEFGLTSAYEVDLWGRIRSNVKAERSRADASRADYQTAAISISAEIVRTWYQLTEAYNQLELVNEQIETNEKALDLMQARFGGGQIRGVDILRQRQLLESTRAQKITAEARVQVLKHQLSVLSGHLPREATVYQYSGMPDLPPLPETGIPLDLVRRRPDVQSSYNQLLAADHELASAISSRYPRLSLTASVSSSSENIENLFEDWAYAIAGNLLTPILAGGRLKAESVRTRAVREQRLYEYGQTVLVAFREVEDALILEQKQAESIQSLQEQADLAKKAYEQLRIEYFYGFGNYLDVLTALGQEQQLRRSLLSEKLVLLEYRIALYRALAGGFEPVRETENET
jgi:multidrug efflux system outer membrane protein